MTEEAYSDEVIETSDIDEKEQLASVNSSYWHTALGSTGSWRRVSYRTITLREADDTLEKSSPKRIKTAHAFFDLNPEFETFHEPPRTPRKTHSLLKFQSPDPLLLGGTRSTNRPAPHGIQHQPDRRHVSQSSPAVNSRTVAGLFSSPPLNSLPSLPSDALTLEPSENQILRKTQSSSSLSSLSSHIDTPARPVQPDPPPGQDIHDGTETPGHMPESLWAPRRNLRRRKPEQIRPYTVDSAMYRYITKNDPNARYSTREERRLLLQSQDDDEFQPPQNVEESQSQEETRVHRQSPHPAPQPRNEGASRQKDLPEFLRHGLDSDDDEPEGIREARKRGALALKKLEQEKRERKKKAAQQKLAKTAGHNHDARTIPKAFPEVLETPLSDSQSSADTLPKPRQRILSPDHRPASNTNPEMEPFRSSSPAPSSRFSPPLSIDDERSVRDEDDNSNDVDAQQLKKRDEVIKYLKRVKGGRLLQRLFPTSHIGRILQIEKQSKKRAKLLERRPEPDASESELRPGQSKVKRSAAEPRPFDFRGDQESSEPEFDTRQTFSPPKSLSPPRQTSISQQSVSRPKPPRNPTTSISASSSSSSSSDEADENDPLNVGDDEILLWQTLKTRPHPLKDRPSSVHRERSLVDYMLTRSVSIGRPRRAPRKTGKGPPRSRHHHNNTMSKEAVSIPRQDGSEHRKQDRSDVVTGGARKHGGGIQSTLHHFTRLETGHAKRPSKPSNHRRTTSDVLSISSDDSKDPGASGHIDRNTTRIIQLDEHAQKRKRQKERIRSGVHAFSGNQANVESGRQTNLVTLDLNTDFVPHAREGSRSPGPRRSYGTLHANREAPTIDHDHDPDTVPKSRSNISRHRTGHTYRQAIQYAIEHGIDMSNLRPEFDVDFGIEPLNSGIRLSATTYTGSLQLASLANFISKDERTPSPPPTISLFNTDVGPNMEATDFALTFRILCERMLTSIQDQSVDLLKDLDHSAQGLCRLLSYFLQKFDTEAALFRDSLREAIMVLVVDLQDQHIRSREHTSGLLAIYWFVLESSIRLSCTGQEPELSLPMTCDLITDIVERLRSFDIRAAIKNVTSNKDITELKTPYLVGEFWIKLIHVVDRLHACFPDRVPDFWSFVNRSDQEINLVDGGEFLWQLIFGLNALSQFTVNGMTTSRSTLAPSWDIVVYALKKTELELDPVKDKQRTHKERKAHEGMLRTLVARCFKLWNVWHWSLDDAPKMFDEVVKIFRSRKFACLHYETADFPEFLRYEDPELLNQCSETETSFELFLKLLLHAARSGANGPGSLSSKSRKLLSTCIPVGNVSFPPDTPPLQRELSLLYNRYSAIIVALMADPTPANMRDKVRRARAITDYKRGDINTRIACIRGAMYLAFVIQDKDLPLDDILNWYTDMWNVLLSELTTQNSFEIRIPRAHTKMILQSCLASIRRILVTPKMEAGLQRTSYPHIGFISGPWVGNILAPNNHFPSDDDIRLEVRELIQAFLLAREDMIPLPKTPRVVLEMSEDSQQDENTYWSDDMYDIPDIVDIDQGRQDEISRKDKAVQQFINQTLTPGVFRLIQTRFGDHNLNESEFRSGRYEDADKWVDAYVKCAQVTVRHGLKDWEHYFSLGQLSWQKISYGPGRRRVGLRFMYTALLTDPSQYPQTKDKHFEVLLTSLISLDVTLENAYVSLFLTCGGLQHPYLDGLPYQLQQNQYEIKLTVSEFLELRPQMIETVFRNLDARIQRARDGEEYLNIMNGSVEHGVKSMLYAAREISNDIPDDSSRKAEYTAFCQGIRRLLERYSHLYPLRVIL